MVDLVRRALVQVALGVQACLEAGPDTGGGGLACFAGGALAGTPVGGAGGLGSSESEKLEKRNKSFCNSALLIIWTDWCCNFRYWEGIVSPIR